MSLSMADTYQEIDLDGFQIVKGEMFKVSYRRKAITLTIWNDEISFSKSAIEALHNCERVRIEINPDSKCILVIPVTAQDKDNVRWAKMRPDAINPRKILCIKFTNLLYKTWGWEQEMAYKVEGKVVTFNEKVMLLFDFNKAEHWKSAKGKK